MTPYKLKILNGVLKLKSFADVVLNIFGIKDLGTQTGNVNNGLVDWSIQHLTKTTAQWNADTTTILLKGQLGIEDTSNTTYKLKIGNGTNLWSALSYVGGGGGGSQDLQSVTDLGATTTNAINTAGITSDYLLLDTSATNTNAVGKIVWNNTLGTGEIGLKGGNINAKLAQDLYARVVNKTSQNLLKANYQAVKIQSAQGQRLAVNFARANTDLNSADTIGIIAENINNNQEGFVITVGQIENVNTTGSLQGETWADGDVLYLSPTTAGNLTNIKPDGSTGHIVVLGYVEYSHQNNGKIYVKIMNGWELDELHNVYINQSTIANNDALVYESSTQLWKNKTLATVLGYTPENSTKKGIANGYASLDSSGKIPSSQLNLFNFYFLTAATINLADATSYYIAYTYESPSTTEAFRQFNFDASETIKELYLTSFHAAAGTSENVTIYIRNVSTATDYLVGTYKEDFTLNTSKTFSFTGLNIAVNSTDFWTVKILTPTWVTNPTAIRYAIKIKTQ
jgi:hypothetical protein